MSKTKSELSYENKQMEETIKSIDDEIHWVNQLNNEVLKGRCQPLDYLGTIDPNMMDVLTNLSREQLINIIMNYSIVQDNIFQHTSYILDDE